jgi:hypothetical protein
MDPVVFFCSIGRVDEGLTSGSKGKKNRGGREGDTPLCPLGQLAIFVSLPKLAKCVHIEWNTCRKMPDDFLECQESLTG